MVQAYIRSTFSSLAVRNYRIYFWAQLVSLSGNWIRLVALAWLVLQLRNSGALLGIITGLQFLPSLLLGPVVGVVVDRIPKIRLISWSLATMGLCSAALALLTGMHVIQLWMVVVIVSICGVANAFELPAHQTFVAELVNEEHVRNAVTLGALEANLARIVGPALGAICLAKFSISMCFILDALSFVMPLVAMWRMRPAEFFISDRATAQPSAKGQLRESFTYLRSNVLARTILLMMILVGTLACEFFVTLPLLAKTTFLGTAGTYASMISAMGLGAIVGGLFIAGKRAPSSVSSLNRYAILMGVFMILVAAIPSLPLVLVALFFTGAAQLILTTSGNAMLMLHTAPEMRGRMNAWWVVIFMGSTPIGGPLMGWIAQVSSPGYAIALGGIACIVATAWTHSYRHAFTLASMRPGRQHLATLTAHFSRSS